MTVTSKTGTFRVDATGVVTTLHVKVTSVRWEGGTTAGHTMILHDADGFEKLKMIAAGSNNTEETGVTRYFNGITLDTLASGVLWIEYETLAL